MLVFQVLGDAAMGIKLNVPELTTSSQAPDVNK